ncbi:hypothetical protein RJT34_33460 [Clitoria ternatea]|uniref:Calmodulin-binding domain-containing protein n=1 Tax=Clitoria ternatea TaxID=43366 RepID=A0AAN9EYU7_CLITE
MAEESTTMLKCEKIDPEDVDEKANPNERLTSTKVPPKILSRYLSSPRGSCHDLCKYGIPHAVEAKPWSPTQKRVTKRERKAKVPEENVTSLVGKKKTGTRPSLTSKTEKVTSEKNSQPFEETNVSLEHNNSDLKQAHSEPSPLPVQECPKSQTKKQIVKNKNPSGSSSPKETKDRSKQKRTSLTTGKEKPTSSSLPLSPKHNFKKSSSSRSKSSKNLTRVSSPKNHENVEEAKPELASSDNLADKSLDVNESAYTNSSEEPNPDCDATKLSSPPLSSSGDKSLKQTSKKTGKSGVSSPSTKGLGSAAGNKGKINMQHKTRSISRSASFDCSFKSNSSLRKQNGATSKSNKTGHGHEGENVKVGYKIRPKMSTVVGASNKVIVARKLTFRRGKVIELQPQSNNIPRRLKFRPARILSDDAREDITRKRTIMENEVDGGGEVSAENIQSEKVMAKLQTVEGSKRKTVGRKVSGDRSKIDGSKSGSEKVVLRHQNVEGKKQNPRLYNNVIEETATMLAELRKSKVKALVGAFETVISLDSSRETVPAEVGTAC